MKLWNSLHDLPGDFTWCYQYQQTGNSSRETASSDFIQGTTWVHRKSHHIQRGHWHLGRIFLNTKNNRSFWTGKNHQDTTDTTDRNSTTDLFKHDLSIWRRCCQFRRRCPHEFLLVMLHIKAETWNNLGNRQVTDFSLAHWITVGISVDPLCSKVFLKILIELLPVQSQIAI